VEYNKAHLDLRAQEQVKGNFKDDSKSDLSLESNHCFLKSTKDLELCCFCLNPYQLKQFQKLLLQYKCLHLEDGRLWQYKYDILRDNVPLRAYSTN